MLILLSPSKTLDFETAPRTSRKSQPRLLKETERLAAILKEFSEEELAKELSVSEKLAHLNYGRYQNFETPFTEKNSKQAILAFHGDVYTDIEIEDYTEEDFSYAQDHVRILSGFYGVLRALDLMQPYRLEMHTKLKNERGRDLYAFWDGLVTEVINEDLRASEEKTVVNLASQQYFSVLNKEKLEGSVVTPIFKEKKGDDYKIVALFAKRARGMMTNFAVQNHIENPQELKKFKEAGYEFNEQMSSEDEWVFVR